MADISTERQWNGYYARDDLGKDAYILRENLGRFIRSTTLPWLEDETDHALSFETGVGSDHLRLMGLTSKINKRCLDTAYNRLFVPPPPAVASAFTELAETDPHSQESKKEEGKRGR
jgi:hypothetical protein